MKGIFGEATTITENSISISYPANLTQAEREEIGWTIGEDGQMVAPANPLSFLRVKNMFDEIKSLADNWDGYGACVPSENVINRAVKLVSLLPEFKENIYDIMPNPHGTISIEFGSDDKKLSLEIGESNYGYFTSDGIMFDGADKLFENITQLKEAIKSTLTP